MEHLTSQQEIPHRGLAGRKALVFVFDQTNVLKTSVKLSDYLSSLFSSGDLSTGDKLIRHMAPEALQQARFSEKSNGCVVCWEILTLVHIPYFEILGFPTEERMIAHVSSGCSLGPHQQLLVGA